MLSPGVPTGPSPTTQRAPVAGRSSTTQPVPAWPRYPAATPGLRSSRRCVACRSLHSRHLSCRCARYTPASWMRQLGSASRAAAVCSGSRARGPSPARPAGRGGSTTWQYLRVHAHGCARAAPGMPLPAPVGHAQGPGDPGLVACRASNRLGSYMLPIILRGR